jgi:hypothetical protein
MPIPPLHHHNYGRGPYVVILWSMQIMLTHDHLASMSSPISTLLTASWKCMTQLPLPNVHHLSQVVDNLMAKC